MDKEIATYLDDPLVTDVFAARCIDIEEDQTIASAKMFKMDFVTRNKEINDSRHLNF